ncbi:CASP8 and FADD-like apoptosis regulator [Pelobates fuscus]|uniref:CASP8 and FADD-like apoptosis regulator n=1 Tax=Pelobates fuscus TaxID=191477 RepID=UPI002FE478EE
MTHFKIETSTLELESSKKLEMPSRTLLAHPSLYFSNFKTPANPGMNTQLSFSNKDLLLIEEELGPQEVEEILFLCMDFAPHSSIRELLSDLNERSMLLPSGLAELLSVIKRFDLLKRFLNMSSAGVKILLVSNSRILSEYRVLMVEIHEELEECDLESLLFLLKSQLRNGGKLPKKTFLSLVIEMEKVNLIGPGNLDVLEHNLKTIRRMDLRNKLIKKKQPDQGAQRGPYINAFKATPTHNNITSIENTWRPTSSMYELKGKTPVQESAKLSQAAEIDERYEVRHDLKRYCLIIDCVGNDASQLELTFNNIGFEVEKHMYVTAKELENVLQKASMNKQLQKCDMFMCFIISRGNSDSLFGINQETPEFSLDKVNTYFTGQACQYLIGKPKLFFIHHYVVPDAAPASACSMIERDGPDNSSRECDGWTRYRNKLPNEADIFWSHCKVEDQELQMSPGTSSLYLRNLCSLLSNEKSRTNHHFLDIHTQLNSLVFNQQPKYCLQLKHTLTKKLYLPSF